MAQIDYNKVKLIVENNLRNAGLTGVFENGWKQTITVDSKNYDQTFNLQGLRDIIAQSIVDSLTDPTVNGTLSVGNVTGVPVVVPNTTTINITTGTPSKDAVRVGDETKITSVTDPKFVAWMTAVNAFIVACSAVTGPGTASVVGTSSAAYSVAGTVFGGFPPSDAKGKTTSGSNTVKIGD